MISDKIATKEKTVIALENNSGICYCLFRLGIGCDRYEIQIDSALESKSGFVRGKLYEVAALFDKIVNGRVEPYILDEIVEDFSSENE